MSLILPRRRLLKAGAGLLLAAPSIVRAGWQSRDSNYNQSIASSPPSSSAWGDHGTNVSVSTTTVANDTVTGLANSYSSVRGTQAHSSGKFYFEIKLLTAPAVANFIIGMMDNTTANGAPMDDRLLPESIGHQQFNGSLQANSWNGVSLSGAWTLANNDIMGIAVDFDAATTGDGFYYLHLNNTYFLGGDPTSGAAGTGHVGNGGFPGARPMLTLWGGSTSFSGISQLITGASALSFLPSGYSAWG